MRLGVPLFLAYILFYWLKNKILVNADSFISSDWLILNHAVLGFRAALKRYVSLVHSRMSGALTTILDLFEATPTAIRDALA